MSTFTAFCADYNVIDFPWSKPNISDNVCFFETVNDSGFGQVIIATFTIASGEYRSIYRPEFSFSYSTNTLTVKLNRTGQYSSDNGLIPSVSLINLMQDGRFENLGSGSMEKSVTFGKTLVSFKPYGISGTTPILSQYNDYIFNYSDDYVIQQKLDDILSALNDFNGIDTSKAPQQSDKDTINSTESKQDELMESTNPTEKTESLQTDLMSFVNSAPDTLNVAKSMFDRLVSGKIGIIVFGSVCLAIFPLLINVIKGRGG